MDEAANRGAVEIWNNRMINEQGLNVRVLNIDSRKRSSGTAKDCEITLGSVITLPAGAVAWVTAVSVPFACNSHVERQ